MAHCWWPTMPAEKSGGLARKGKPDWKDEIAGYWGRSLLPSSQVTETPGGCKRRQARLCAALRRYSRDQCERVRTGCSYSESHQRAESTTPSRPSGLPRTKEQILRAAKMDFPDFHRGGTA